MSVSVFVCVDMCALARLSVSLRFCMVFFYYYLLECFDIGSKVGLEENAFFFFDLLLKCLLFCTAEVRDITVLLIL